MAQHKVDAEPKWSEVIDLYLDWIKTGSDRQKEIAKESIMQIVKLADTVRQSQKQNKVLVVTKTQTITFDSLNELKEKFSELK